MRPIPPRLLPLGLARILALLPGIVAVQPESVRGAPVNHDESKVPAYTLPDPLRLEDGRAVTNATRWFQQRRPELLALFEEHVYGHALPRPSGLRFRVLRQTDDAAAGRAVRRDIQLDVFPASGGEAEPALRFSLLLPRERSGPVPAFVGIHLFDTASPRPQPAVARRLASDPPAAPPSDKSAADAGSRVLRQILARGYALASLDLDPLCPDSPTNWWNGAGRLLSGASSPPALPTRTGALGVWAWGLSRALDYLEAAPDVDARRVAVIGHSRMGKAALWAGALDARFALILANNSGCGGAALSKRDYGETIDVITRAFPHWFCGNLRRHAGNEAALPVDQHQLLALLAPRPVYIGSAVEDRWADPRGEFLAALHADPVYRLLGASGLGVATMPAPDQPVGDALAYHYRRGQHDLTDYDWERYLDFADRHLQPGR